MNSRGLGFEFCFLLFLVGLLFKQNGDIRAKCFPGWQCGTETEFLIKLTRNLQKLKKKPRELHKVIHIQDHHISIMSFERISIQLS